MIYTSIIVLSTTVVMSEHTDLICFFLLHYHQKIHRYGVDRWINGEAQTLPNLEVVLASKTVGCLTLEPPMWGVDTCDNVHYGVCRINKGRIYYRMYDVSWCIDSVCHLAHINNTKMYSITNKCK